jgi:uncharacterized protein YbjT (DUF2867 family)
MTILITGANGAVSSSLLASSKSEKVRAMVRDPAKAPEGVDVVVGDLDEPSTLVEAIAGADTLWLLTAMGPQAPHAGMNACSVRSAAAPCTPGSATAVWA